MIPNPFTPYSTSYPAPILPMPSPAELVLSQAVEQHYQLEEQLKNLPTITQNQNQNNNQNNNQSPSSSSIPWGMFLIGGGLLLLLIFSIGE